jgi:receptor expression-enhancing protein 5/6
LFSPSCCFFSLSPTQPLLNTTRNPTHPPPLFILPTDDEQNNDKKNQKDQSNVPKEYISLLGAVVALLTIVFGLSAGTICGLVGFLYPAAKSLRAIERKSSSSGTTAEVTQWLIYWVVYSFFSIIEVFVDYLLYWIPFYYAFKMAFLLWAMMPQTRGAKFLYDSFLKDFLKSKESTIDAAMRGAKATVGNAAAAAAATAATTVAENVKKSGVEKKGE